MRELMNHKMHGERHLFKSLLAGVAVVICVMMFAMIARADVSGKVISSNVNVRSDASTSSEAVGSVQLNDKVTILDEKTGTDGKVWYKIETTGGVVGYVRSDFIKKDSDSQTDVTQTSEKTAYISSSNGANIRKEASTSSDKIATAAGNSRITIIGEAKGSDGMTWYQIKFSADGKEMKGFVREDCITFNAPVQDEEVTEIEGSLGETPSEETPTEETPTEAPSEQNPPTEAPQENTTALPGTANVKDLVLMEPDSMLENPPAGFEQVDIDGVTAWAKQDFYIIYASQGGGEPQWFLYDSVTRGYVNYSGLFAGMTANVADSGSGIPVWIIIIVVVLVVLCVGLGACCAILAMKASTKGGRRNDDDDDDYDDYDDDEDDIDDMDDDEDEVYIPKQSVAPKAVPVIMEEEDDEEDVEISVPEMNYVNQRPMTPMHTEPASVIIPEKSSAQMVDEEDDEEDDEEYFEEKAPAKKKKAGWGKKFMDFFTEEVPVEDDEDDDDYEDDEEEYDDDVAPSSDDDDDDDLDFLDL